MVAFGILVLASTSLDFEAHASVVRALDEATLTSGSDAVVEGRVVAVASSWNAAHTGLETRVEVEVAAVLRGFVGERVVIVQPGGRVPEGVHVIAGMPELAVGEHVRLYLRRVARPGPEDVYRVYGWAQGKWVPVARDGRTVYAPALSAGESPVVDRRVGDGVVHFTHNGMVWPDSKIPVPYLMDRDGSDDVPLGDALAAIQAALATWADVPCSRLSYTYAGETDLDVAVDGQNVFLWIESGWIYGEEAAAATSLWIPVEEERTADIAFNGEGFSWAIEPEAAISYQTLDIQAVATHELGHFSGLGHTMSSVDTMYFSWRPWPGQRSLSADDKLGLCALYPELADECTDPGQCPAGESCDVYAQGRLCSTTADPIGAACSYERIECGHFCLFTEVDLSAGYCSRLCDVPEDCPNGFHCAEASAGGQPVRVCFVDEVTAPDAGPGPDSGPGVDVCTVDDDCPGGQHCGVDGECTYACLEPIDCPAGSACDPRGRCVSASGGGGGCGCASGESTGVPVGGALLLWLCWVATRRAGCRLG